MQAAEFISKWSPGSPAHELNELAGAQAHFIDPCRVLAVPEPDDPERYCFERGVTKTGSRAGAPTALRMCGCTVPSPGNTRRQARAWKLR